MSPLPVLWLLTLWLVTHAVPYKGSRLEAAATTQVYRDRLDKAYDCFIGFLTESSIDRSILECGRDCDAAFVDFITHAKDQGQKPWIVRHALVAVQGLHDVGTLERGWRALDGWEMERPRAFRVPLPFPLFRAMFLFALNCAMIAWSASERYMWMSFAVLLRLGYFGLLRGCEIVRLRVCDICFTESLSSSASVLVVSIIGAKNWRSFGQHQMCTVSDEGTVSWCAWLCAQLRSVERLWIGTYQEFKDCFRI